MTLYGDDYPTPDGTCVRDYIHVADLATAHLLALEAIEPGRHEVFNLGNGNMQIIDAVREASGRPVPVRVASRRPGDFMVSVASSKKAAGCSAGCRNAWCFADIVADAWQFNDDGYGGERAPLGLSGRQVGVHEPSTAGDLLGVGATDDVIADHHHRPDRQLAAPTTVALTRTHALALRNERIGWALVVKG